MRWPFASTMTGTVRRVEAREILSSINWRMRASRAAFEVPPRTTATMCFSSRRTDDSKLYPEANHDQPACFQGHQLGEFLFAAADGFSENHRGVVRRFGDEPLDRILDLDGL